MCVLGRGVKAEGVWYCGLGKDRNIWPISIGIICSVLTQVLDRGRESFVGRPGGGGAASQNKPLYGKKAAHSHTV